MKGWRECKLGGVCSDISYGYTESASLTPIGPKFLRITDIVPGRVNWETVPYCKISDVDRSKYKLLAGDIVIARTGATTGYTYTIKPADLKNDAVFASYLIRYRLDKQHVDPMFVGQILLSPIWKGFVEGILGGSAQPGANAKQFADFEFLLPPLPEQRAIAGVLSSLDDKIDLLNRQNKTLEALVQTLCREWFEDPEEENRGQQKGVENILLGDVIETISKTHPLTKDQIIFLNTSDIDAGKVIKNEYELVAELPGQAKKSIKKGDILFSEIRPANKRYAYIDFDAEDYVVSTRLMVLRSKNVISQAILYFYLTYPITLDWLQLMAESRSGTFPQITFDQIKVLSFKLPKGEQRVMLSNAAEAILAKICFNNRALRNLRILRDAILPKLISGELRVKPC